MSGENRNELDLWTASAEEISEVMKRGVAAALREHKRAGRSIVVWEDGNIVTVPADQIVVPDESPSDIESNGTETTSNRQESTPESAAPHAARTSN